MSDSNDINDSSYFPYSTVPTYEYRNYQEIEGTTHQNLDNHVTGTSRYGQTPHTQYSASFASSNKRLTSNRDGLLDDGQYYPPAQPCFTYGATYTAPNTNYDQQIQGSSHLPNAYSQHDPFPEELGQNNITPPPKDCRSFSRCSTYPYLDS
jgi:hypothetical protein